VLPFGFLNDVHDAGPYLEQVSLKQVTPILCNFLTTLRLLGFLMELANIKTEILLLILDKLEFEPFRFLLDILIG
jgi:hypothetical protein